MSFRRLDIRKKVTRHTRAGFTNARPEEGDFKCVVLNEREEPHELYFSPNIRVIKPRGMRLSGGEGEMRGAYSVLVGKLEGKWALGIRRLVWEDNIKMNFKDIAWGGVDWADLPRDRDKWLAVVDVAMNFRVP